MSLADKLNRALEGRPKGNPRDLRPEILLHSQIPKPMHGVAPRVILGRSWWDEVRAEAYRSTNYHCLACGVHKYQAAEKHWLEGHELYDINYIRGRMTYLETVPLCHYCHNFIHAGRLQALRQIGKVTQEKFDAVMAYGEGIIKAAGLKPKRIYKGQIAPWSKWRLVLDGKRYPPIYRSLRHWAAAHDEMNQE